MCLGSNPTGLSTGCVTLGKLLSVAEPLLLIWEVRITIVVYPSQD